MHMQASEIKIMMVTKRDTQSPWNIADRPISYVQRSKIITAKLLKLQ